MKTLLFILYIFTFVSILSFQNINVQFSCYVILIITTCIQVYFLRHSIFLYLIFGLYIYSFPHVISVYSGGSNELFNFSSYQYVYNDLGETAKVLRYTNIMIVIFALFSTITGFIRTETLLSRSLIANSKMNSLGIILFMLFFLAFSQVDFSVMHNEYTLTEGLSLVFGIAYLLFGVMVFQIFVQGKEYWNTITTYLSAIVIILLMSLGVRQVIVWFFLALFFGHFLRSKVQFSRLDKRIVASSPRIIIMLYFLLLLVLQYRFRKSFEFSFSPSSLLFPIQAETSLTFASFYHVIMEIKSDMSQNFIWLFDYFTMLVPSQLWPSKYNYLVLENMQQMHNLTPFGTYFLPSILYISSSSILGYMFQVFTYAVVISILWLWIKRSNLYLYLAPLFLSFAVLYPVRGTFHGGFKIFTYFIFLLLLIKLIGYIKFKDNEHSSLR